MAGQNCHHIGTAKHRIEILRNQNTRIREHIRVMHGNLCTLFEAEIPIHLRRRIPRIIRIVQKRPAQKRNLCTADILSRAGQRILCELQHMRRHKIINPAGQHKERLPPLGIAQRLCCNNRNAPLQMIRILGETVPANTGTGPENRTRDPFAFERVNPCPDIVEVNSHRLAIQCELIRCGNLQITERILGSLCHFSCSRTHRNQLPFR